jgi:hypothetical protein
MNLILLMALFSTPDQIEPHQEYGYAPLNVKNMETCLTRRASIQRYFEANLTPDTRFTVFCVEMTAHGYDEALDAFNREISDPT